MPRKTPVESPSSRSTEREPNPEGEATDSVPRVSEPRPRFRVNDLMQGQREIILVHRGQDYLLRITATGKLILTK